MLEPILRKIVIFSFDLRKIPLHLELLRKWGEPKDVAKVF